MHNTPSCIGVIMDGNRRWARKNGLPVFEGHRVGYQKMKELVEWASEAGVGTVIVYAFSEENWKRTTEELGFMMGLIRFILKDQVKEAMVKNVRLKFIGNIDKFSKDITDGMRSAEEQTAKNTGLNLLIAVSYGGRQEIVQAVNSFLKSGVEEVDMETFSEYLYTASFPDPDLIIRTSGEMRMSGFLPWQSIYSELFFTQSFWPDFSKEEFQKILNEYSLRQRRLGK